MDEDGLLRRSGTVSPEVVIYTREHCGLCRRATDFAAREARGATVRHVDVDTDAALERRYGVRVPVVVVDGVEVAELEVAAGQIRRAVRAARRQARSRALGRTDPSP